MRNTKSIGFVGCIVALVMIVSCGEGINLMRVVTNPIDVDYAFTREHQEGGREAADPVVVLFKDRYYLFPSKSYGYWSSEDMQHWTFHTNDLMPFHFYAPTAMVYRGELYWAVSFHNKVYKTSTPEDGGSWVVASDSMMPYINEPERWVVDPYFFVDDDERVYLYWGCSQVDPIMGVELDPEAGFRAKTAPVTLIPHREKVYGWECRGDKNETENPSSNEGSAMLKHDGRYYLQYAGPGTEYDSYGDGLYVGDNPLGPFEHHAGSPFSVKPGGWMTGAGHGDTFQDKYGNWWHVSSTVICQRFLFERRIGFYPVVFTKDGGMQALTDFSDYPYILPDRKVDWTKESPWSGWMDLTIGKTAIASSEKNGHPASFAADNTIKTWWSAQTGKEGEWLTVDLERLCNVHAIQVNFADEGFGMYDEGRDKSPYRYHVEGSRDGERWQMLFDKTENTSTRPHELLVLPKAEELRYVRLKNTAPLTGQLSLFDLRVFGLAKGKKPAAVSEVKVQRSHDRRRFDISWPAAEGASGYFVHWGVSPDELYSACQTLEPHLELGLFSADQEYFFRVDAFNDCGVTKGK